jgi:hypothetical protein
MDNSAFLYKLAEACLGRKHIFCEGIAEEMPRMIRPKKVSDRTFIVHFAVGLYRQMSDRNTFREAIEERRFIVLCTHYHLSAVVKVNILDSISITVAMQDTFGIGAPPAKLCYNFVYNKRRPYFPKVFIRGTVYRSDPMLEHHKGFSKEKRCFVDKYAYLAIDPHTQIARRIR